MSIDCKINTPEALRDFREKMKKEAVSVFIGKATSFKTSPEGYKIFIPWNASDKIKTKEQALHTAHSDAARVEKWAADKFGPKFSKGWVSVYDPNTTVISARIGFPPLLNQAYMMRMEDTPDEDYLEFQEAIEEDKNPSIKIDNKGQGLLFNLNNIDYELKATFIISKNLSKIKQWEENKSISSDLLYKKIQELGVPSQQLELLRNSEGSSVEEKLLSFSASYSFSVESNVAKSKGIYNIPFSVEDNQYEPDFDDNGLPIRENNIEKGQPTSYYSNLTVPGGTNYTENEISTPLITPSIKGHAQFSTDNGIGWFRSDDLAKNQIQRIEDIDSEDSFQYENSIYTANLREDKYYRDNKEISFSEFNKIRQKSYNKISEGTPTKTRRILEVQSDLYQKSRDIKSPDEIIAQLQKEGKLKIDCN